MTTQRTQHNVQKLLLGVFLTAAMGCAGNIQDARPARGVGEWTFRLPDTKSSIHELAYGRGGNSTPAAQPVLASADMPKSTQQRALPHHPRQHAVAAAPAPAQLPSHPEQAEQAAEPAHVEPAATQEPTQLALADTGADQRYGAREAESRELQKFKGGDGVVIGVSAGALVVVLLIVLLILLLR